MGCVTVYGSDRVFVCIVGLHMPVQVWRVQDDPCEQLYRMLTPSLGDLPPAFQRAANYHIGVSITDPPLPFLQQLRQVSLHTACWHATQNNSTIHVTPSW